jgi:hypothetical protein
MIVSAWRGGSGDENVGTTYGIRVSRKDRGAYFQRAWRFVFVEIEDGPVLRVPLKPSFWKQCTELTHAGLAEWMLEHGLVPWPKGKPPKFELEHLGERRFRLRSI